MFIPKEEILLSIKYIEGKKVYLRPYGTEEDKELLYQAVCSEVISSLTGNTKPFTRKQIDEYVEKIMSGDDSRIDFVIVCQENQTPVGEVVLNEIENRNANIRICLFEEKLLNKGYGTEAMKLMLDYGFGKLNLHRIELSVYDHNKRGIHVYEKLGFKKEGVLREYLYNNHRYYDLIIMSMLENEYREKYLQNAANK